jgi:small redox-active disulfide protein 2
MKTIKILGTGCPNCKTTEEIVNKAISELNIQANVEKVEDIMDIMKYDVMSTPAVVIDEKVMIKGRVPSVDEIKALLSKEESCCSDTDSSCCEPDSTDEACCSDTDTSCCEPTIEEDNSGSCCC